MATKPTYAELEQRIRELETGCAEPAPFADHSGQAAGFGESWQSNRP